MTNYRVQTNNLYIAVDEPVRYHSVLDHVMTTAMPGAVIIDMAPLVALRALHAGRIVRGELSPAEYHDRVKALVQAINAYKDQSRLDVRAAKKRLKHFGLIREAV